MNMKKNIFYIILLLCLSSNMIPVIAQNNKWKLVFSDEFNQKDGSRPDAAKWSSCVRTPSTWARWISDNRNTSFIKKGRLICRTIPNKSEVGDTAKMLSGAIETKGKFDFQYGKIEVRMRTNNLVGNFPAVWLVPTYEDGDKRYGEIDVVEMFGNEGKSAHTVHTHRSYTLKKEGVKRDVKIPLDVTKWHVYGLEWDKDKLIWTIDGDEVFRYNRVDTKVMREEGQWTFDRKFYIRMNQSVGNGGHRLLIPNFKKTYETQFDWIRVFQRK